MIKKVLLLSLMFLFPIKAQALKPLDTYDLLTTEIHKSDYKKISHVEGVMNEKLLTKFEAEYNKSSRLQGNRLIIINSPGGDTLVGEEMLNYLEAEKRKGVKIYCMVMKEASSMAFNLLSHCDFRYSVKGAYFLVHKVEMNVCKAQERKTAQFYKSVAEYLDKYDDKFRKANAKAMHLSLNDYDYYANNETMWNAYSLVNMGYLNGYAELLQ